MKENEMNLKPEERVFTPRKYDAACMLRMTNNIPLLFGVCDVGIKEVLSRAESFLKYFPLKNENVRAIIIEVLNMITDDISVEIFLQNNQFHGIFPDNVLIKEIVTSSTGLYDLSLDVIIDNQKFWTNVIFAETVPLWSGLDEYLIKIAEFNLIN